MVFNTPHLLPVICIDPGKRIGWATVLGGIITACGTVGEVDALPPACAAVIEEPVIWGTNTKDPHSIMKVQLVAGKCAQRYPTYALIPAVRWRGNVPEDVLATRISRALLPHEPRGRSVHARDAVGIGLWLVQRLHARQ
jgi:hypothetical protein